MAKVERMVLAAAILLLTSSALAVNLSYAPATNIRRTMSLLGRSTPENPNTVRILVYGQSISEQAWHLEVRDALIARFPDANIIWANHARGGCASDCLINYVQQDVNDWDPDLVIFHVYGSHIYYEQIIASMRSNVNPGGANTEVLITNDHYTGPDSWSDLMSYTYVPGFASKYLCGFIDVRHPWIDYLNIHYPEPRPTPYPLTIDGTHLNDEGNHLLASLIIPYLVWDPNWLPLRATKFNPPHWSTGVSRNANLSWMAGIDADSHDVYFGTSAAPPFVRNQTGTTFDPGTMEPNKTHYWRIDPRNKNGVTTGVANRFQTGFGAGTGLLGKYYDNADLTNLKLIRTDPIIDCNWTSYSPDPAIAPDAFSVSWTGQVEPLYSETYTFYTFTDDGTRLWVNNQLLIDKWQNQSATEWSGVITLAANTKYDIKMEYYDNTGDALAQLRWSSASQTKQIVPQARLYKYPQSGDLDADYEIDLADTQLFFDQWLTSPDCSEPNCADLDDSNNVDFFDLAIMGQNWGL